MPLNQNPANTRTAGDLKTYRSKIKGNATANKEIKEHLNRKDPGKYPNPLNLSDAAVSTFDAHRDFTFWPDPAALPLPNRLGGALSQTRPPHLGTLPPPNPGKFTWTPPSGGKAINIDVRADGAIVHKDTNGNEIHEVHPYMHAIFDHILYMTRDYLEAINQALESYGTKVSTTDPAAAEAQVYRAAVGAFEDFVAGLQPGGGSPYAGAFNFVGIAPVVTNEGFIVSCRVKLNWKNPYHSSSTIRIP